MAFHIDIETAARTNTNFRKVLYTARHCQVVVMSLSPREEIGREVHTLDQVLVLVEGDGQAEIDGQSQSVRSGELVVVPAGVEHNVINTGTAPMKLYTIYAPPEHPDRTVHATKAEADAAESD